MVTCRMQDARPGGGGGPAPPEEGEYSFYEGEQGSGIGECRSKLYYDRNTLCELVNVERLADIGAWFRSCRSVTSERVTLGLCRGVFGAGAERVPRASGTPLLGAGTGLPW